MGISLVVTQFIGSPECHVALVARVLGVALSPTQVLEKQGSPEAVLLAVGAEQHEAPEQAQMSLQCKGINFYSTF